MVCKTEGVIPVEFDKKDFNMIEDKSNILSMDEKLAIIKELGLVKLIKKELENLFKD